MPQKNCQLKGTTDVTHRSCSLLLSSSLLCSVHSSSVSSTEMPFSAASLWYASLSISALHQSKTNTQFNSSTELLPCHFKGNMIYLKQFNIELKLTTVGLHLLPFKEPNAVLVSIYFCYPHWLVLAAVLLVYGSMEGVQQPQHSKTTRLSSKVSWSPSMLRPQTGPGSVLNENPDSFCMPCR